MPAAVPENVNYKFTADIFTSTEVAGNLCDFFKIDNEHIALFFADVTEKGIAAGLHMMTVKKMFRKALLKNSPEKALKIVNEELFNSGKNIPLKIFAGILNLHSGVLQTFNAGHVDPVIKSRDGRVKFIKGPFIPLLGTSLDAAFTSLPLQLNAGDKLCFYSNDMIEVQNGTGEKYGTARLLDIFSSDWDDAHKVIDSIYHGVKEFAGANATDADIAIAILEYTPENA
jgi:sigma-B regulation protein RsbU (phosphoserine phosphatase)